MDFTWWGFVATFHLFSAIWKCNADTMTMVLEQIICFI